MPLLNQEDLDSRGGNSTGFRRRWGFGTFQQAFQQPDSGGIARVSAQSIPCVGMSEIIRIDLML
jgi:hypothetical protein